MMKDVREGRDPIFASYIKNQVEYLSNIYKDVPKDQLEEMVKDIARNRVKVKECEVIVYGSPGQQELKKMRLLDFTNKYNNKMIAPCGTVYQTKDKLKEGNSVEFTKNLNTSRSNYKKKMFSFFELGDMNSYNIYDSLQALAKILVNSIPGGHGFVGSPFYDVESFNAITSIGRNGIVMCYSLVEILLASNYACRNKEQIVEYITNTTINKELKEEVEYISTKYNLYIPTTDEIVESFLSTMIYYQSKKYIEQIRKELIDYVDNLDMWKKVLVFYRRNMYNLFTKNDTFWRLFLNDLFSIKELKIDDSIDENLALKIPSDFSMMLSVIYGHLLDNKINSKKVIKDDPDIGKKYVVLANLVNEQLKKVNEIFETFLYKGEFLVNIPARQTMIRKSVPISDTDSIIYTTKSLVSWWTHGDLRINQDGLNITAFIIYILGLVLDSANREMSIVRGVIGDDVNILKTKYEFLFSAICKTDLGKHYFGHKLIREGQRFKTPELEIKGVSFQTSNLPEQSREFARNLLNNILDEFSTHSTICISDLIYDCMNYEKEILQSLLSGNLDYYGNTPIKMMTEYKDWKRSIYFNYVVWENVFADKYGHIQLPGKYTLVPLKTNIFKNKEYVNYLIKNHKDIYDKLNIYMDKYKKENKVKDKSITRIVLPVTIVELPEIFLNAIDVRKIIYKNLAPVQLTLQQLGLYLGYPKQQPLLLDYYSDINVDRIMKKL